MLANVVMGNCPNNLYTFFMRFFALEKSPPPPPIPKET